jgi:4-hydroxy-3-methylbut-2-enyl diphosphate reductase
VETTTRFYQKGLGLKNQIQGILSHDYKGAIVDFARAHGHRLRAGDLTLRLAREFGFCYGVDRAVEYAYETRAKFPDRRIFITGEIIHNPFVNQRLEGMGIRFLAGPYGTEEKFARVTPEDVVILPAFGVSTGELEILKGRGAILVDTTCGSVMNVWKNVERYARDGFTSVIHGKYGHEETKATSSRATRYPDAHYLVIRDMAEAYYVCRFIEGGGSDDESFLPRFAGACSPGFTPSRHLERIGLANQTTMLSSESLAIEARLRESMVARYGQAEVAQRFRSFDTICTATQERQDAVRDLVQAGVDLMLVIGGYNSSNTTHLAEMAADCGPTFHISDADCLVSPEIILHKPPGQKEPIETRGWLVGGPLTVGITAGASTPDVEIDQTIRVLLSFRDLDVESLTPVDDE